MAGIPSESTRAGALAGRAHQHSDWCSGHANGGFLIADDIGSSGHDTVSWNTASHNPGGCGVIIAGHSKSGARDNWVAHNWLIANGTNKKAAGAGVVIATEVPGETVAGNTVIRNWIYRNGIAGVTIHSHVAGQHMNGNRIMDNWIGRNNLVGDEIGLGKPVKNVPDPGRPASWSGHPATCMYRSRVTGSPATTTASSWRDG